MGSPNSNGAPELQSNFFAPAHAEANPLADSCTYPTPYAETPNQSSNQCPYNTTYRQPHSTAFKRRRHVETNSKMEPNSRTFLRTYKVVGPNHQLCRV